LLASREFDEQTEGMRPTVQVGDPFSEKLLNEATIELIENDCIAGIQDMGAAGISCSTSEMSAKKGLGMIIDLDKVPLREQNMSAYEIMLSESQERMLAVIHADKIEVAKQICDKWDVPITLIGHVTDDGILNISRNGKQVCSLIADSLVLGGKETPKNIRETSEPEYLKETRDFNTEEIANQEAWVGDFWAVLQSPTIASKRWIYEQYDSQVRTNTVSIKGDAAIIRLKEIPGKAIAVTTDSNSRYVYLDPYTGTKAAVAEAARNVVCVGAKPVAITNCLNFGNPYNPEVYWQFKEAIRGMGDACKKFDTPVTGGNVSFYNESQSFAVFPTPTIGMLGIIEDLNKTMSLDFKKEGDKIAVLGINRNELGGSEYLKLFTKKITGQAPILDLDFEFHLQQVVLELIDKQLINSAHDTSEGGLAICLAEMAMTSNKRGCKIELNGNKTSGKLFGESQSRIVIAFNNSNLTQIETICNKYSIPIEIIGEVISEKFILGDYLDTDVNTLIDKYENAIPAIMNK
jgi:phosphoribosylformylglycinamidine synthase